VNSGEEEEEMSSTNAVDDVVVVDPCIARLRSAAMLSGTGTKC